MKIKEICVTIALLFVSLLGTAQSTVQDFIQEGIGYHDVGDYDKAIEVYKKALKLDAKSPLANYEIALSYFQKRDYDNAIKHSEVVLKQKDKYIVESAMIKGSALDVSGKTKQSIKFFKKIIKKTKPNYLLHFNLGVNYFKVGELDDAEEQFIKAIELNPNHGSSHWLLANIHDTKGNTIQTLLAVHYFLFLEPESSRSEKAYAMLQRNFGGNVSKDKDKPNTINISLSSLGSDSEFSAAELMVSMLEVSKSMDENKDKTEEELFEENTATFFGIMGELKEKKNKSIWWTFYTPFFYKLSESEHMETYCKYITQVGKADTAQWLRDNEEKVNAFDEWLKSQE